MQNMGKVTLQKTNKRTLNVPHLYSLVRKKIKTPRKGVEYNQKEKSKWKQKSVCQRDTHS